MKKILCIFILTLSLMTICGCGSADTIIGQLFEKNYDYLNEYFFKNHNAYVDKHGVYTKNQAKNKMAIELVTFEACYFTYVDGSIYFMAASYETEELAKQGLKVALKYNDCYQRKDKIVYMDCHLSYLLMYGEPQKKEGILFYELEDGNTLFFDMECSCDKENTNTVFKIPNWIEIVGGSFAFTTYRFHMPKMEELIIPDSVTEIKYTAFLECKSLKRIRLSKNLKIIGKGAFGFGGSLEYVVVPKSIEKIGEQVFDCGNIYCEAEYKPTGWKKNFAVKDAKVYWASEWEYNEEGIPVPIVG